MVDCIFCKIIAGEIPSAMLIETERVVSFLDVGPVNPGHALVVPTRHVESFLDLSQDELHTAAFMAQRVARAVAQATGSPGFNVLLNKDECAGQLVPHVHFHVIPRRPDDGYAMGWRQLPYAEGEAERMADAIRGCL